MINRKEKNQIFYKKYKKLNNNIRHIIKEIDKYYLFKYILYLLQYSKKKNIFGIKTIIIDYFYIFPVLRYYFWSPLRSLTNHLMIRHKLHLSVRYLSLSLLFNPTETLYLKYHQFLSPPSVLILRQHLLSPFRQSFILPYFVNACN